MEDQTADFRTSAGAADIALRVGDLAEHLPDGLKPLASVAYNAVDKVTLISLDAVIDDSMLILTAVVEPFF